MSTDPSMTLRAGAIWSLLLVVAFAAALLRTSLLEPRIGEPAAHVAGTLFVVLVFAFVIWRAVPWVVPDLARDRLAAVGLAWTLATMVFEFGFGHYVMGHPWTRLLADYDIMAGRLWLLVLLTILLMPLLAGELQRGRR